ncbi:MAG: hypothetical protein BWY50_01820 [Spirochaetes bacterium ADurb.Bin315]|nr:MAG: hypothetical protein BWY50_01820 [Spirochaetes bacterium ADurb.Bin315]
MIRRREHLVFICGHSDDEPFASPDLLQHEGFVRLGNLKDVNRQPFALNTGDDRFQQRLGVSIHARPHQRNLFFPRPVEVGSEFYVVVDDRFRMGAPDDSVARSDHRYLQTLQFFDPPQHEGGEGRDDVRIVALRFAVQVSHRSFIKLVVEAEIISTERSERIAREENPVLLKVGHHRLRPVDVRGKVEDKRLSSEVEGLSVGNRLNVLLDLVERFDEGNRLRRTKDLDIGIAFHHLPKGAGMIRFHMVDDQKVQSVRRYGKLVKLPVDGIKRPVPILDHVDERSGFAALHDI